MGGTSENVGKVDNESVVIVVLKHMNEENHRRAERRRVRIYSHSNEHNFNLSVDANIIVTSALRPKAVGATHLTLPYDCFTCLILFIWCV